MRCLKTTKEELRKKFKFIRENVKGKEEKSRIIMQKILQTEIFQKANVIAFYQSLPSEVDTKELINASLAMHKVVLLPKIEESELNFYQIHENEKLITNQKLGIQEPAGEKSKRVAKENIDLIIVPGICFDREKNRLGFGSGYYDRFLANSTCHTIGICFQEQILENELLPINEHDKQMDEVITESNIQ